MLSIKLKQGNFLVSNAFRIYSKQEMILHSAWIYRDGHAFTEMCYYRSQLMRSITYQYFEMQWIFSELSELWIYTVCKTDSPRYSTLVEFLCVIGSCVFIHCVG